MTSIDVLKRKYVSKTYPLGSSSIRDIPTIVVYSFKQHSQPVERDTGTPVQKKRNDVSGLCFLQDVPRMKNCCEETLTDSRKYASEPSPRLHTI